MEYLLIAAIIAAFIYPPSRNYLLSLISSNKEADTEKETTPSQQAEATSIKAEKKPETVTKPAETPEPVAKPAEKAKKAETKKPVAAKKVETADNTNEFKPSIPEDSSLNRHFLSNFQAEFELTYGERPTELSLRRHYDSMLKQELESLKD